LVLSLLAGAGIKRNLDVREFLFELGEKVSVVLLLILEAFGMLLFALPRVETDVIS
jgi:hypothetical protein